MQASELHAKVEAAFNAADVDALVDLYEPGACMQRDDGTTATGLDAIRDVWAGFVALGGHIAMTTRYAIEDDDVALLSNTWVFEGAGMTFSSATAEVARRQADGSWRYLIDNPFGARPEE